MARDRVYTSKAMLIPGPATIGCCKNVFSSKLSFDKRASDIPESPFSDQSEYLRHSNAIVWQ
eukprot:2545501-Pleurochrysis_carterae.AAC.2